MWEVFKIALTVNTVIGEFLCEWTIGFSQNSTPASLLLSLWRRPLSTSQNIILHRAIRDIFPDFQHIIFLFLYLILLFMLTLSWNSLFNVLFLCIPPATLVKRVSLPVLYFLFIFFSVFLESSLCFLNFWTPTHSSKPRSSFFFQFVGRNINTIEV